VARSRLPRASRNVGCEVGNSRGRLASRDKTAVASNPVSRDLAAVDRWAARTGGPHPAGAMKTGANTIADSEP
jgi:hypothetical protein